MIPTFPLGTGFWLILAVALAASLSILSTGADAGTGNRPNIVMIMTDDEDVAIHAFMPKTKALIEDQGTNFRNFFVSYPFCCPSRASILRGQYGHNTDILGNELPWGGAEKFRSLGLDNSTLATWLKAAGYRNAMVGKYLNRYGPTDGVPPGWRDWYVGGNAHPSYDYDLNENGRIAHYGNRPQDYLNDVLTAKAVGVIREAAAASEPLFLYVLPYTPHSPSTPAPRHEGLFSGAKLPQSPAFDEADVSDKPAFIKALPQLSTRRIAELEEEYRRRLRSLQAIDDMVESIIRELEAAGLIDNTYIVYSSDNGFHLGEHRLPAGKDFPYEEDIRVPMVMRGPGVPKGGRIDAMVLNSDLAPTFAAIAGIQVPDFVDGRSFLPLLSNRQASWRQNFLIERRQFESQYVDLANALGMPPDELERAATFNGIRTAEALFVEYATGEHELYDLRSDPHQLSNLAVSADPELIASLSANAAKLAECANEECRRLEDLPVTIDFSLIAKQEPEAPVTPASAN